MQRNLKAVNGRPYRFTKNCPFVIIALEMGHKVERSVQL